MGIKEWFNKQKFLILVILIIVFIIMIGVGFFESAIIPQASSLKSQVVNEEFDNLDGEGEIKWYDGFFTWNPTAQVTGYPFITGSVTIRWDDFDTGLMAVSVPYTTTKLVVELELRGTKTYTQILTSDLPGASQPQTGIFDKLIWVWIDVEPGDYDEHIKGYWSVKEERIPLQFVRNGEIVQPVTNFVLYRGGLTIPQLLYLPVVMKAN